MRRFWLKKGDRVWDLTTRNDDITSGSFFGGPEGLGVKTKIESFEIERAFFIEKVSMEPMEISGKLYFTCYEHFRNFVGFIGYVETREPMRLYYSTDAAAEFDDYELWYKAVLIKELKKGEIDVKSGWLICDVKFAALSRWKKDKLVSLELAPVGTPLVYPYMYPYVYGGKSNMAVEIDNTGNLPTPCIVRIEAETENPLFRILQNGEAVDQAKYNIIVRPGSYMIIDSAPEKQEASLYTETPDGLSREDIYYTGEKDYSYSNFITIPEGRSVFLFTASNSYYGRVSLKYSLQRELT